MRMAIHSGSSSGSSIFEKTRNLLSLRPDGSILASSEVAQQALSETSFIEPVRVEPVLMTRAAIQVNVPPTLPLSHTLRIP